MLDSSGSNGLAMVKSARDVSLQKWPSWCDTICAMASRTWAGKSEPMLL